MIVNLEKFYVMAIMNVQYKENSITNNSSVYE